MSVLVLDSQAFSLLARPGRGRSAVRDVLQAAWEENTPVVIPAAVLAEQYRGGGHDQVVDSYLGRTTGISVIVTDRELARQVGHLLARARRGSRDHVDATVVATALAGGGGVIATTDSDDLTALASGLPGIAIVGV